MEGAAALCFSEPLPSISTLKDTVREELKKKETVGSSSGEEMQSVV